MEVLPNMINGAILAIHLLGTKIVGEVRSTLIKIKAMVDLEDGVLVTKARTIKAIISMVLRVTTNGNNTHLRVIHLNGVLEAQVVQEAKEIQAVLANIGKDPLIKEVTMIHTTTKKRGMEIPLLLQLVDPIRVKALQ